MLEALIPYLKICRFDHWIKNIFIFPGVITALVLNKTLVQTQSIYFELLLLLFLAGITASANYTINEYLDKDFDKMHPIKKNRYGAMGVLKPKIVFTLYISLSITSLAVSYFFLKNAFWTLLFLLFMGVIYNVPPIRSKDLPYLDVISESINNPIRFMLGWSLIIPTSLPPASILICYWMGGAYLMGLKRFSELRSINNHKLASLYRKSFKFYSEERLLVSSFFYAITSAFFLGIFLIKYRAEFILLFPVFSLLFADYLRVSYKKNSSAQAPEKLYKEHSLLFLSAVILLTFILCSMQEIPLLHKILNPMKFN